MMRSYYRAIHWMRTSLVLINYAILLLYTGVFLIGTKFIVAQQKSLFFLSQLSHVPKNPVFVLSGCMGLYGLFLAMILSKRLPFRFSSLLIEWGIAFLIILLLDMASQSIVLLVICDCLYHARELRSSQVYGILAVSILLYFLTNFSIMSQLIPLTDLQKYFTVFPAMAGSALTLSRSLLEGANLLIFLSFIACFMINQYEEKESIAQELDMVNQVNQELRNYAALTEQIAENNERKRIAREIHDTLGHALTGIAAGIDACLVMIDKKPEAVKVQLQRIRHVVTEGIGDVRNSLQKLRPGALEERGLEGAIRKMIEEFVSLSDVNISLIYQMPEIDFEKTKEDALFRMIQECVTNSIRHGRAKHIDIRIAMDPDSEGKMIVRVKDDGTGCAKVKPGYGLMQMKERISTIHGTLYFEGTDGFLCEARIPLQKGEFE